MASSPEALARGGDGPCFLDFATWKKVTGGSFLATERRLRAAVARLNPGAANHARLALAQFYLANGFAAEGARSGQADAGGRPGAAERHAAANHPGGGRLSDGPLSRAHNDIAGAQFDADRHAALWRGLIDAAFENWDGARANFERASTFSLATSQTCRPVRASPTPMRHWGSAVWRSPTRSFRACPERWKSRSCSKPNSPARAFMPREAVARREPAVRRGRARRRRTGRGQGHLLSRRRRAGGGNLTTAKAANALERLRFRWRGDILELNTLRKLASLYFAQKQWRDGYKCCASPRRTFPTKTCPAKRRTTCGRVSSICS